MSLTSIVHGRHVSVRDRDRMSLFTDLPTVIDGRSRAAAWDIIDFNPYNGDKSRP